MIRRLSFLERVILFFAALCLYAFLFSSNLRLLTTKTFLIQQHKRLNISKEIRLSFEEVRQVDVKLINFIYSNKAFPLITRNSERGKQAPLFTKREISHLYDVRSLLKKLFLIQKYTFALLLILFVLVKRKSVFHELSKTFFYTGMLIAAVIIFLSIFVLITFDIFFTAFHTIFFKSGTWVFTSEEMLPQLFPEKFWLQATLILLGAFIAEIMVLISFFVGRIKSKRRESLN